MSSYLKSALKKSLPKSALRWRTRKVLNSGMEPDLYLLANIRKHLPGIQGGEKFLGHFSKEQSAIDVGACGGEYSCVMSSMFGKVFSIEPTADMAEWLKSALPRNCQLMECAIGATIGEVSIRVPRVNGVRMNALSTVADHGFELSMVDTIDTHIVQQLTIDRLASEADIQPSFLKIDVEGYEGNVLLGSRNVIESYKPVIMIEIEKRHNTAFHDIFKLLGSQGYIPFHFCGGKLTLSGPRIVEESFNYLERNGISGMMEVISTKVSEKYLNNFIFIPLA